MIEPTVGRIVWFRTYEMKEDDQPYAAIITYVHGPRMVNLMIFAATGAFFTHNSVRLLQDDDSPRGLSSYCIWMPYQIGQAKRHADEEAKLAAPDKNT